MGKKFIAHIKEEKFILRLYGDVGVLFSELLFLLYDILYRVRHNT
jgi:hypothetical protein